MLHSHRMEIFACKATEDFAGKLIEAINTIPASSEVPSRLGDLEVTHFSDGEFQPSFQESVRGATVFIVQSTVPPTDNLMELTYADRKRVHNLKYYTWVEQQQMKVEDLNAQWYDTANTWDAVHAQAKDLDILINEFNEATGLLKAL